MNYTKTLEIKKSIAKEVNRLLDIVADGEESLFELTDMPEDATIEVWSVEFEDGTVADLRLCSGNTNMWLDPILFERFENYLTEVCVLDAEYELNDGDEYIFENDDNTYSMIIRLV